MPDNINITVNETIENIVINPSISTDVIDVNTYSTTENVTIDVTPNLTTVNINTITGSLITKTSDLINDGEDGINPFITLNDIPVSGLTSVGLTMPVAFNVANSPLTSDGTIAVSAAGTSSQYIRGDGQLATLPTGAGGGSTVAYYLNGSINASVAGYKQLSNLATIGGGTDFTLVGNGLIAQFLTDLGNPNRTEIPGGAWNFEMFFQSSSAGGSAKFYVELLKYDGITFTSIASSVSVPEEITGGTAIDLYLTSLAVPTTTLLVTDRLAIRVYIVDNSGGRTITLHTEDNTLCEIITTFSGGVTSLNGLTANTQYLAVGTTGIDFNISSLVDTHTFNLPTASATNRGALTSTDWTAFNAKFTLPSLTAGSVLFSNGTTIAQDNANLFWDDTNNRLNLGGIISNTARLGIKAPGPFTDIALQIRNSADTGDISTINGLGRFVLNSSYLSGGTVQLNTIDTATNDYGPVISFNGNYSGTTPVSFGMIRGAKSSVGGQRGYLSFHTGASGATLATESLRINWNGNILIGTLVDQGGRLQIKAPGALSTDIALRVRNSADTGDLLTVAGNGTSITKGNQTNFYVNSNAAGTATGRFIVIDAFASSSPIGLLLSTFATERARFVIDDTTGNLILQNSWNNYGMEFNTAGANTRMFISGILGNIGIGTTTPVASAKLQVESTTQGFLPPRMTTTERDAIATPAIGLQVFNTTLGTQDIYNGTSWNRFGTQTLIRAPGALSTDIALRIRNSANTGDLMTVNGLGTATIIGSIIQGGTGNTLTLNNGITFNTDGGSRIFASNYIQYQSNNTILQHRFTNSIGSSLIGTLLQIDTGGTLLANPVNLIKVINQTTDVLYLKASGNLLIGTATDVASSKLTVESTTQGFLPPRMTNAQRIAIATPAVGLCVYCTDVVEGLYINKSTGWTFIG